MFLTVTTADRELARLSIDISGRLGEEPDPRMEAIANAVPLTSEEEIEAADGRRRGGASRGDVRPWVRPGKARLKGSASRLPPARVDRSDSAWVVGHRDLVPSRHPSPANAVQRKPRAHEDRTKKKGGERPG